MAMYSGTEIETPPLRDPHTPRAFGILNIVFAMILLAGGFGINIMALTAPFVATLAQRASERQEPTQKVGEDSLKIVVKIGPGAASIVDEDGDGATEVDANAAEVKRPKIDVQAIFKESIARDPAYLIHFGFDLVTGLVLNLLMFVAGIGLIYLKGWGRWLAISVAGLKLIRLLILAVSMTFAVNPVVSRVVTDLENRSVAAFPEVAATDPHVGPEIARWLTTTAWVMFSFGSIYPIATLTMLRGPAIRAAFRQSRTS